MYTFAEIMCPACMNPFRQICATLLPLDQSKIGRDTATKNH